MSISGDQFYHSNKSMTTKYEIPRRIDSNSLCIISGYANPDTSYLYKGTTNTVSYNSRVDSYFQPTKQGSFDSFTGGYRGRGGLGNP